MITRAEALTAARAVCKLLHTSEGEEWIADCIQDTLEPPTDCAPVADEPFRNLLAVPVRCSECNRREGSQHRPSCHRQGLVTSASDYRDRKEPTR